MKQRITLQQLMELSEEHQQKLQDWGNPRGYHPLLSIGQMIEYLDEHVPNFSFEGYRHHEFEEILTYDLYDGKEHRENHILCDILWEAVKSTL